MPKSDFGFEWFIMSEKRTYFIVDDDRVFIKLLTRYLASDSVTIASRTTSSDALQEIKRLKPDCLILDIMMPDIDGLELCVQVRAEPALDNTKIVMVSGKAYEIDRKRAFDMGADGYIVKPVAPDKIAGQIQRIVEDRVEMTFWGVRGTSVSYTHLTLPTTIELCGCGGGGGGW